MPPAGGREDPLTLDYRCRRRAYNLYWFMVKNELCSNLRFEYTNKLFRGPTHAVEKDDLRRGRAHLCIYGL